MKAWAASAPAESDVGGATDVRPYLSVVACSRNDGHGGHLLERMQLFIDGLADQVGRYGVDCELVLVDWNPPAGVPGLADALRYPDGRGHLTTRVIAVPANIHAQLPHADSLPLFQMIAKNVGIRRSRGSMVLSTNIDILFPDVLFAWLAGGSLDEDALYRADRRDIQISFDDTPSLGLGTARGLHPVRVHRRDGTYDAHGNRVIPVFTGVADAFRYAWNRWRQPKAAPWLRPARPDEGRPSAAGRALKAVGKVWHLAALRKPHVNACGDFTLMSHDNWFRLGAHAEWPIYSWNLDSLLLYQARAFGVREVDLPHDFAVLHIDHSQGSGWTPEGAGDLFSRMAGRGVPVFTDSMLMKEARSLGLTPPQRRRPRRYSPADWGYEGAELTERSFPPGSGR